jgi:Raf kinase inhibitor-like YbhB/YbcL family protein
MKKRIYIISSLILVVSTISVYSTSRIIRSGSSRSSSKTQASDFQKLTYISELNKVETYGIPQSLNEFRVESNGFRSGEWIPLKYVCNEVGGGENTSIPIKWSNAPIGTKSFAIFMYDTNPVAKKFVHWAVINIPRNVNQIIEGASCTQYMPSISIELKNSAGNIGYIGPCPPKGTGKHEYIITVYALKTEKLGLDKNAGPAMVGFYLNMNTIAKASLVFYYKR